MNTPVEESTLPAAAPALPRNALEWLKFFGPGAILASLTIGVGELVFSTRAGGLFGYKLLWFFAVVLFFKWLLVYSSARHMAITGAHPFQRWTELPGPRGWFALIFLILALVSFPIWVGFHSGTLGTLVAAVTGTAAKMNGAAHFVWGIGLLLAVMILTFAGGYKTLERAQIAIVGVMLLSVVAALLMLHPNWSELLAGLVPQAVHYPGWAATHAELSKRPIWVETVTYVGIIGGSGYDYLAYVSYLRDKGWVGSPKWLRPILFDSVVSFVAVLLFTVVFTACGAIILGPQQKIPSGSDLLTLQTQFITPLYPRLTGLYFAGAFLAVFGTLYGTIEVAPATVRELVFAFDPALAMKKERAIRRFSIAWVCAGGLLVLGISLATVAFGNGRSPPALVAILTPANLFTGVLACGCICVLSIWADRKHLQERDRMPRALVALNAVGGVFFMALGFKSYWDYDATFAWVILAGTVLAGMVAAMFHKRR
jgi:hypothetical protein